ncbi:TetR/AcrR family transcriptional regulator [Halopseudomonas laoshanensis]|uniref:TetR/AcrR family transcriptional regulator n=1 Tax=Halopseudomonas laoshanensis TaxID=2268758 RepID=A0A7V7GWE6_9GAMM|nr:TetR/AcrR family transcriptional regulator [Halopseudomonas laoshanensis]KAA0696624.1 TetR/AcrR family transcriptional regulator [Halopseudomonas laoshanensis]
MPVNNNECQAKRLRKPPAERCEEILYAAIKVFAEQGFRCTDVQQIADLAGVGKGTVYRFYPTKDELFQAAVDDVMLRLTSQVDAAVQEITDPLEHLKQGFRTYMSFFQQHPEAVELFVHECAEFGKVSKPRYFVYSDLRRTTWLNVYQQLIDSGRCRVNDPEQILNAISNLAYGSVLVNRISGRNSSLEVMADELLDTLLHGVLGPTQIVAASDE